MKKTKFVSLIAAMFAASTLLSSCWCKDDSASTDITSVETGVVAYSIAVQSNVAATVKVGSQIKDVPADGEVLFENLEGTDYTVTATAKAAGDFLPSKIQTVDVKLTEEKTSAVVVFNYVDANSQSAQKVSDLPITDKTTTAEIVVKNDAAAEVAGTKEEIPATLTIPAATTVTDNSGNALAGGQSISIVAYYPPIAQDEELPEVETTPAVTLECKPDGTQFGGEGATLKAYIGKEASGAEVEVNGDLYIVDADGYVTFKVKHFSSHTASVKTNHKYTEETITLANQRIDILAGKNTYNYTRNFGWESSIKFGFFFNWHLTKFGGDLSKDEVTAEFDATTEGPGTILITQVVRHYTIRSGFLTFNTDVYGAVTVTVTPDNGQPGSAHSGGMAK